MKVLLLKDVYKLGRAGDIKKVADGYGRNYLIPHNLAVLATAGAINQADYIRAKATEGRAKLNTEMGSVANIINNASISFASKAGETGKLYGSITSQMISDSLSQKYGVKIDRRQVEVQPIRLLGEHKAHVRLTIDLVPEIKVIVYREGEKGAIQQPAAPKSEPSGVEKVAATPNNQVE